MYAMKKTFLGNVCLVVFTAFLFTIILGNAGLVGGGRAEAAAQPTAGTTPAFSTVGSQQQVEVQISPVTQANWNNIVFDLLLQNSSQGTIAQIAGSVVYGGVYSSVYGTVYHSVYNNLLTLRYLAPSGVAIPTTSTVVYQSIYEDSVASKIYVTLIFRPPETSSSGGGGGGSVTPVVDSNVGETRVDTSAGLATVTVDANKIADDLASAATAEVKIDFTGAAAQVAEKKVELPAEVVTKIAEAGKSLAVNTGEVSFAVPPGVISREVLKEAGAGAKVELAAKKVDSKADEAKEAVKAIESEAGALKAASDIISLTLAVVKKDAPAGQAVTFSQRIEVAVKYDQTKVTADKAPKAGLYRFTTTDPKTGQKLAQPFWQYVRRSRVDPVTGKAIAKLKSFSLYSVMLFEKSFADLAAHWAKNDVELMASRHVVNGRTDSRFDPEAAVTRAEFAAMIQRTLDLNENTSAGQTFADVPGDAWYAGAVTAAANAGIVKGLGDGTFKPEARITRQEMAVMIVRALELEGKVKALKRSELADSLMMQFADRANIADWAFEASATMVSESLLQGRSAGEFAPKANSTRAEGATMIKRFMGKLGEL